MLLNSEYCTGSTCLFIIKETDNIPAEYIYSYKLVSIYGSVCLLNVELCLAIQTHKLKIWSPFQDMSNVGASFCTSMPKVLATLDNLYAQDRFCYSS